MRVLLTGAAGFIGRHVADALASAGHETVGLDAYLIQAHGERPGRRHDVAVVDVRDAEALDRLLDGVDVVCHQAAMVGNGVDAQDLPAYADHNDHATAVLLAAMSRAGVDRLVLASSMVVYGDGRYDCPRDGDVAPARRIPVHLEAGRFEPACDVCGGPVTWRRIDEGTALLPRTGYAASKVAQEQYADAWCTLEGRRCVALRYHNVYGPGMPANTPYAGVAAIFRSALARNEAPRVFEDGRQTRDFVHVEDVARANVAAVERVGTHAPGLTPYNVCSGTPYTIGDLAATLARTAGGPAPVTTGEHRPFDVRHVVAAPDRACEGLGFTARIGPETGIAALATAPLRGG